MRNINYVDHFKTEVYNGYNGLLPWSRVLGNQRLKHRSIWKPTLGLCLVFPGYCINHTKLVVRLSSRVCFFLCDLHLPLSLNHCSPRATRWRLPARLPHRCPCVIWPGNTPIYLRVSPHPKVASLLRFRFAALSYCRPRLCAPRTAIGQEAVCKARHQRGSSMPAASNLHPALAGPMGFVSVRRHRAKDLRKPRAQARCGANVADVGQASSRRLIPART